MGEGAPVGSPPVGPCLELGGHRALSPQAQRHITDLYEDLRDGHNLISLLEVLSGDSLVRAPRPGRPPRSPPTPPPRDLTLCSALVSLLLGLAP